MSQLEINSAKEAEEYRKKRQQSHKSTQNIVRMKDGMKASDPAVLEIIEERNR